MSVSRRQFLSTVGVTAPSAALASAGGAAAAGDESARDERASRKITDGYAKISDDLTLHYQTAGTGDLGVVFVPGWTMTTRCFEHQMRHLAHSRRFTAVTFDPRAHGLSTTTIEGHYYEQHARDLKRLLDALEFDRFVLAGWSAGGGDILEYVRLYGSERLAGLVLIDTPPKARGTDYTQEWVWFGTKDEGDQDDSLKFYSYDTMIDREAVNVEFARWMLDDPSPENIRFVTDMTNTTPNSIAALLNTSYWYLDNTEEARSLNGKVPLLYYTRAEWHDLAVQWAREHTPEARVESFGKHLMFWEHAPRFNRALDEFLAEVE